MTADLAGFLLARIAEDEGWARAASPWATGSRDYEQPVDWRRHMWNWSPARVLAECDAKRRIIANHAHTMTTRGCGCDMHDDRQEFMDCDVCVEASRYVDSGGWCLTVRALALPYADHPDYRNEWRP